MKKSLDYTQLLSENFFTKLFNLFKIEPADQQQVKSNKKIQNSLNSLNKSQDELETALEDLLGKKIDLNRYSLKDFLR